jgi:hypothetical protein
MKFYNPCSPTQVVYCFLFFRSLLFSDSLMVAYVVQYWKRNDGIWAGPRHVCSLGSPVIWLPFKLIFFIVQHLFSGGRERLLFCSLKLYTYFFVFKIMDLLHAHNILTYLELSFIPQFFRHSELDSVSHIH